MHLVLASSICRIVSIQNHLWYFYLFSNTPTSLSPAYLSKFGSLTACGYKFSNYDFAKFKTIPCTTTFDLTTLQLTVNMASYPGAMPCHFFSKGYCKFGGMFVSLIILPHSESAKLTDMIRLLPIQASHKGLRCLQERKLLLTSYLATSP